ncbi:ribonuclease III [Caldimonas brevitalea]|uniref:Ribonuclease 3 n=1 Tax=Caldimonas brevitalea TaxID=413882 RepID=A0A0G3BUU2_9BURK|nr:ribonuclease III [Caldimonas brevitalea]AKJ31156.1 ribonuclease III [Caldimonas brevitalea]
MSDLIKALERRLDYRFRHPALLARALTHRSFGADHNERLEFLGDSVLGLAIAGLLYERFAGSDEGDLSRVRASLVRQDTLHRIALGLELPACLRLGEGEARSGGAQRPSILADAVEAVFGAIYLDGGFDAARTVVQRLFTPVLTEPDLRNSAKDAKTELQEWLQARKLAVPSYAIVATRGHAHQQQFVVSCTVPALQISENGEGASRRAAEQVAAQSVLAKLKASGAR